MERGVYFDAWFPHQHCYHPSLPPRRLTMVDDLNDFRATMLVWSALGGGVVSLPYLEEEAHGEVPPRFRFYGFLNDAEFIAECQSRGITVYGIVFEHAWEFPAELDEDENRVLALNETRGIGKSGWLGLREFWQNRYPKIWPPFENYFPDGIRNSDGELVRDPLKECAQRDIHGNPLHALWIEVPGSKHYNIMMERNNVVWREYLKGVIRTQIDAGVGGIQFDEAETPITSLQYGGCFCTTCTRGFREFLQELPDPPEGLTRDDLESFHYGDWLLARGYDFTKNREETPLFDQYMRFQRRNIVRYFGELADYAREYAASKGRTISVTGNFFNLFEHYYPMREKVDVLVTEMRNTTYRQPSWYRYAAGFAGEKPLVVVENPYGGVIPDLLEALEAGRERDRFRMSVYEAAALGVNMSLPYGSWMGSEIPHAFYAPRDLCREIGHFLAEHEDLYSTDTYSELGVVFSAGSAFRRIAPPDLMGDTGDNRQNLIVEDRGPFWSACEALSIDTQIYDVCYFPDDELGIDHITEDALFQYATVLLPGCEYLTERQATAIVAYLRQGGKVLAIGNTGANLQPAQRTAIIDHPAYRRIEDPAAITAAVPSQAVVTGMDDVALNVVRLGNGDAGVHFIRYDYDPTLDAVPSLPGATIEIELPEGFTGVAAVSPGGRFTAAVETPKARRYRLLLRDVPLYGILRMTR